MTALPKPTLLSCRIPFGGFYESLLSGELDNHQTQEIEYFAGQDGTDLSETIGNYAPELAEIAPALPEGKLAEALADAFWDATDYSKAYAYLARQYAEEFTNWLADTLEGDVATEFEEMVSPRFYNFGTDRLFVGIGESALQEIAETLHRDAPDLLPETFRKMFTSYDGFISHYDNTVPNRDLSLWDHNELYALLNAWVEFNEVENIDFHLYDYSTGGLYEDVYRAHDLAVDWDGKFTETLAEWAERLADEYDIDVEELPYRCPLTLELPL